METKTIRFEKGGFVDGKIKSWIGILNDNILFGSRGIPTMQGVKYEILKSFTVQINIIEDEQ